MNNRGAASESIAAPLLHISYRFNSPVDSRNFSVVRTCMMRYGVSGSLIRESRRSAAIYPILELGISTVVRCGSMIDRKSVV